MVRAWLVPQRGRSWQLLWISLKNPNPPMPKLHPSPLDDADVTAVSEYVRTLQSKR